MDFKNNHKNRTSEEKTQGFWERLSTTLKDIADSLSFYKCVNIILKQVESKDDIVTAVVSMKIERNRFDNKITFDLIHTDSYGRAYRTKEFYSLTLTSALLPQYISDQVMDNNIFRVNFSLEDLITFHNESDTPIDEKDSFDAVINIAKQNNTAKIILIDRVFYTRIECYDIQGQKIGVFHIGIVNNLPKDLSSVLYPGGQTEYIL